MKILFVCTANVDRSKTAQDFYSEQFINHQFRSAGTDHALCQRHMTKALDQEDIDWSELIIVMERHHKEWIIQNLELKDKQLHVLEIVDSYAYYSMKLIELLQQKCNKLF